MGHPSYLSKFYIWLGEKHPRNFQPGDHGSSSSHGSEKRAELALLTCNLGYLLQMHNIVPDRVVLATPDFLEPPGRAKHEAEASKLEGPTFQLDDELVRKRLGYHRSSHLVQNLPACSKLPLTCK